MNYSGTRTINYFIYRTDTEDETEREIQLKVTASAYFSHGKYNGHPDSCYPDESDFEIIDALDKHGKNWLDELAEDEKLEIHKDIIVDLLDDDGGMERDEHV